MLALGELVVLKADALGRHGKVFADLAHTDSKRCRKAMPRERRLHCQWIEPAVLKNSKKKTATLFCSQDRRHVVVGLLSLSLGAFFLFFSSFPLLLFVHCHQQKTKPAKNAAPARIRV